MLLFPEAAVLLPIWGFVLVCLFPFIELHEGKELPKTPPQTAGNEGRYSSCSQPKAVGPERSLLVSGLGDSKPKRPQAWLLLANGPDDTLTFLSLGFPLY